MGGKGSTWGREGVGYILGIGVFDTHTWCDLRRMWNTGVLVLKGIVLALVKKVATEAHRVA